MKNIFKILSCLFLAIWLLSPSLLLATNYYVTQSGSATPLSTSSGSPSSVATFNASNLPTGGDTVFVTGTVTSSINPNTSGTGTGAGLLKIDVSGASLTPSTGNTVATLRSYNWLYGGGSFSQAGSGHISTHATGGTITPWTTVSSFPNNFLIKFVGSGTHDTIVQGLTVTGDINTGLGCVFDFRDATYNLTIKDNYATGIVLGWFDGVSHDILIKSNYNVTSKNLTDQTDNFSFGDGYNITLDGNFFRNQATGNSANGRHNDVIQTYHSGANGFGNPYPCNLVLINNWIETEGTLALDPTSDGNMSWLMLEDLNGAPSSTPSLVCYNNVFNGYSDSVATNGLSISGQGGNFYLYGNTIVSKSGSPGNTLTVTDTGGSNAARLYMRNDIGYDPVGNTGSFMSFTTQLISASAPDYNRFYHWDPATSTQAGPNGAVSSDPLVTSQSTSDYTLQSGSPAKGTADNSIGATYAIGIAPGATWPGPTLIARPTGGAWDVGAYQSSSSTTKTVSTGALKITGPFVIK